MLYFHQKEKGIGPISQGEMVVTSLVQIMANSVYGNLVKYFLSQQVIFRGKFYYYKFIANLKNFRFYKPLYASTCFTTIDKRAEYSQNLRMI